MHVIQDEVWTEIVDKDDANVPVDDGTSGGVVYTHLRRESQPMIRFHSGDESHMTYEPCPCGRTYPRLPSGVYGRLDDMLIIRGVNVYPSQVQRSLLWSTAPASSSSSWSTAAAASTPRRCASSTTRRASRPTRRRCASSSASRCNAG